MMGHHARSEALFYYFRGADIVMESLHFLTSCRSILFCMPRSAHFRKIEKKTARNGHVQ